MGEIANTVPLSKRHETHHEKMSLPQLCAMLPIAGAMATTTNCGARMQIAITTVAIPVSALLAPLP